MKAELSEEYERQQAELPSIPEAKFSKLKAKHRFKRIMSVEIDKHPAAPVWLIWSRLRWRGAMGALRPTPDDIPEETKQ